MFAVVLYTEWLEIYSVLVDVEIKLDAEGYVLPASQIDDVYKR